jgi:hypothetical protein
MKLDLSKLSDAVNKVAGLAQAHAAVSKAHADVSAERDALLEDHKASQDAVDALTVSLVAAATSPAEAVGLAAVAAELSAPAPDVVVQSAIERALAAAKTNAPQ